MLLMAVSERQITKQKGAVFSFMVLGQGGVCMIMNAENTIKAGNITMRSL